jgi:hypothetical protein
MKKTFKIYEIVEEKEYDQWGDYKLKYKLVAAVFKKAFASIAFDTFEVAELQIAEHGVQGASYTILPEYYKHF